MFYGYEKEALQGLAHEAISCMLSYNVSKLEAYLYLTNKVDLMDCSYELHCCVFEEDRPQYLRECDARIACKR